MPRALSFFLFQKDFMRRTRVFLSLHTFTLNWVINRVHLLAYDCDDEYLTILGSLGSCRMLGFFFSLISLFFVIHLFLSFGFAHISLSRGLMRVLILIHSLLIHNIIRAFSGTRQQIRYYYCHLVYFPFAYCPVCRGRYIVGWLFMAISIPKESHSC